MFFYLSTQYTAHWWLRWTAGWWLVGVASALWFLSAIWLAAIAIPIVWLWRFRGLVFVLALVTGWWWAGWCLQVATNRLVTEPQSVQFAAQVVDVPSLQTKSRLYVVQVTTTTSSALRLTDRFTLSLPLFPAYRLGDHLRIECTLEALAKQRNWLLSTGQPGLCRSPRVELVSPGTLPWWQQMVMTTKSVGLRRMQRFIAEPQAGVAGGLLLGVRSSLPAELTDTLRRTGTIHALAISGQNVVLLIEWLMLVLVVIGCRRQQAFYVVVVLISLFIVMVGAPASAVRAAIMAMVVLLAQHCGRGRATSATIVVTAAVMSIINPLAVRYDIGWQLSFAAVLGIQQWMRWWQQWVSWLPERGELRQSAAMTLAATMYTWPIQVYYFQSLSAISVIANMLAAPFLGISLLFVVVLAVLPPLPMVTAVIGTVVTIILGGTIAALDWLGRLPGAQIDFVLPGVAVVGLLGGLFICYRRYVVVAT